MGTDELLSQDFGRMVLKLENLEDRLEKIVERVVRERLAPFEARMTRIEAHSEKADSSGDMAQEHLSAIESQLRHLNENVSRLVDEQRRLADCASEYLHRFAPGAPSGCSPASDDDDEFEEWHPFSAS